MEDIHLETRSVVRARTVRHVRRNDDGLPPREQPGLARYLELELAFEYERDLLLLMPVARRLRVGLEADEVGHHPITDQRLEERAGHHLDRSERLPLHEGAGGPLLLAGVGSEIGVRHCRLPPVASATRAASRPMPSSMSSSSTLLNDRRTFSPPWPSGKKGMPGTTATPRAAALFVSSADSTPPGRVSQEKNPPSGWVHATSAGMCRSSAPSICSQRRR